MAEYREETEKKIAEWWVQYQRTKSPEIRNQLVLHYIPIVKKIALNMYRRYRYFDSVDELVGEGVIALMGAIDRFDINRNVKFETFISYRVKGSMLDYINKQNGYVRKIYEISKRFSAAKEDLMAELTREPTREEMANYLEMSMEEYEKNLLEIKPVNTVSLNQMTYDSNMDEKQTEISSGPQDDPAEILSSQEYSEVLAEGIKKLNQEQQLVLALFYKEDLTVKEIAEIMNTNTQRVSQVRFQAIKRLKKLAENKPGLGVV
jgi:RNA polymerase sigma factor for flagellar operon FliA